MLIINYDLLKNVNLFLLLKNAYYLIDIYNFVDENV